MTRPDAPCSNEVEISIFGPGYGESVVLHLGNGSWVIVDSCVHPDNAEPTPLRYLLSMGVDPASCVKCIVATHWHDDHIRGLSRIVNACPHARFVCSAACLADEFFTVLETYAGSDIFAPTGVSELHSVFSLLDKDKRNARRASAGRQIWHQPAGWGSEDFCSEIIAMSPSDEMITKADKAMANVVCSLGPERRFPEITPNHSGVVLLVKVGSDSFLLGNDLEEERVLGWTGVLSEPRDAGSKSVAFKVPHHGSFTGHHAGVWSEMLHHDAYSLLSPFIRGKTRLPMQEDVNRICGMTNNAFITADPQIRGRRRRRTPTVDRTINEMLGTLREVVFSQGQVRMRMTPGDRTTTRIDLFEGAYKLGNRLRA